METLNDCWNVIGVSGDHSCPELEAFTHCRNCPVYSAAGRRLLDREAPPGYQLEWTAVVALEKESQTSNILSVVVFRLESEWMALPTKLFVEIIQPTVVHSVPHCSTPVMMGLINVRGEIHICISLSRFLQLETATTSQDTKHNICCRMAVLERDYIRWVFPVDEIHGVWRIPSTEVRSAPVTVARSPHTFTTGLIPWGDSNINYLDDELLFNTLSRTMFP